MTSSTERIRTTRAVYAGRSNRRRPGSIAYGLYAGVVGSLIIGSSIGAAARWAGVQPPVLRSLTSDDAEDLVGVVAGTVWLAGQRIGHRKAWLLPTLLLGMTIVVAYVPGASKWAPWCWVAHAWPTTTPSTWDGAVMVGLGVASLLAAYGLLDGLRGSGLLEQSLRWRFAGASAVIGQVNVALGSFRALPHIGRTWLAVRCRGVTLRFLVSDAVGAARTSGRGLIALAFLCVGRFLTAMAAGRLENVQWVVAAIGACLSFLALGVFSDGFRHSADAAAGVALYGYCATRLFRLHMAFPVLVVIVTGIVGAGVAVLAGDNWGALPAVVFVGVGVVVMRMHDSAKGPLPTYLFVPWSLPFSWSPSASPFGIALWVADGLVYSAAFGALVVGAGVVGMSIVAMWIVLLGYLLRGRLAR